MVFCFCCCWFSLFVPVALIAKDVYTLPKRTRRKRKKTLSQTSKLSPFLRRLVGGGERGERGNLSNMRDARKSVIKRSKVTLTTSERSRTRTRTRTQRFRILSWRLRRRGGEQNIIFQLSPNQQHTLDKLPPELRCGNFVDNHPLSIQVGTKLAKNVYATCTYSDRASILHTTIGGWGRLLHYFFCRPPLQHIFFLFATKAFSPCPRGIY